MVAAPLGVAVAPAGAASIAFDCAQPPFLNTPGSAAATASAPAEVVAGGTFSVSGILLDRLPIDFTGIPGEVGPVTMAFSASAAAAPAGPFSFSVAGAPFPGPADLGPFSATFTAAGAPGEVIEIRLLSVAFGISSPDLVGVPGGALSITCAPTGDGLVASTRIVSASQPAPTCAGEPATIVGTPRSEFLWGTPGRDVIAAGPGGDVVFGRSGDDVICGGDGSDWLFGESGNDRLDGGRGIDVLLGGSGADRCTHGICIRC